MAQKDNKKNQKDQIAQVNKPIAKQYKVIQAIDNECRVITNGFEGCRYGILLPSNILVNNFSVPADRGRRYISTKLKVGQRIEVKQIKSIKTKSGYSVSLLALSIEPYSEYDISFLLLKEGTDYNVVVVDVCQEYYRIQIQGSPIEGYIERDAFAKTYKKGDSLRLYLEHKGESPYDLVHFASSEAFNSAKSLSICKKTSEEVEERYNNMFSEVERKLIGKEYEDFLKDIIGKYPNVSKESDFLDDLSNLYCRYSPNLQVVISSFNKYQANFFENASYWVKYYREEDNDYLLLFNSDDIVITLMYKPTGFEIQKIYYDRTNKEAKDLLERHKDACLKLESGKLQIANRFQSIPVSFNTIDVLEYIGDLQYLHLEVLKNIKKGVSEYRKENAKEFITLKEVLKLQKSEELKKGGDIIQVYQECNIVRTSSKYYKSGIAFYFDLLPFDYKRLINEDNEDVTYVSIVNEEGKPIRSGLLIYDEEANRAQLEFPDNRDVDTTKIKEGFFLKKRNSIEHFDIQIKALEDFTYNRGASFYDDMTSGALPKPEITQEIEEITFFDQKLNSASTDNNQPLAVKRAVGNRKVVLIQGPPGTGKTTVIVEIIRQLVNQGKKVLVCSQAHAAVDNIVEKIHSIPESEQHILSMSLNNEGEEECWGNGFNPEDYKQFLGNNRILIKLLAEGASEDLLKTMIDNQFVYSESISDKYKQFHEYILQYYSASKDLYSASDNIIEHLIDESDKFSHNLLEAYRYQSMDVILGTCIGVGMNRYLKRGNIRFDTVIIDEAAKANLAESLVPMSLGNRFVLVGDDKQLPPYSDSEFLKLFIEKSESWDSCDKDELLEEVSLSLFQKIHETEGLPQECITMLNYQYRMHPDIGALISSVFYDGKVSMGAATQLQQLSMNAPFDKQVVFIDTDRGEKRYKGFGPYDTFENNSYKNDLEASIICERVIPSLREAIDLKEITIGIITPYRAQRDLLKHSVGDVNLKDCVYTIDSIQGKEFDVVVFSFVRAFSQGKGRNVGFLDDMRRLNVSLSRAKKKLILVGHVRTLINPESHIEKSMAGIKPHEVFVKLSVSPIKFTQKTKADIFYEKYNVGDLITCVVDSISQEDNFVNLHFKNDPIFSYSLKVYNPIYMDPLGESKEVCLRFRSYNDNKKPHFEIESFIDKNNQKVILETIESYERKYPIGAIVTVEFLRKDDRGNILVKHLGFEGKIIKNSYPNEFYDDLKGGEIIKVRIYKIDIANKRIQYIPYFKFDIKDYIEDGEIKNFFCKVERKIITGNNKLIEVELDGGYRTTWNFSDAVWFNYIQEGEYYNLIGYYNNTAVFYSQNIFESFCLKHEVGENLEGLIILNKKITIAKVDEMPGYVNNAPIYSNLHGSCKLHIDEIDKDKRRVKYSLI